MTRQCIFFSIDPNELKTCVYTEACTWMLIAALCIIAQTWKQPRCPAIGDEVHPDGGILFSAKNK